jgi:two-component system sensor histidine kinase YesM
VSLKEPPAENIIMPKKTSQKIIRLRTKLIAVFAALAVLITLLIVTMIYKTGSRIIEDNTANVYLTGLEQAMKTSDEVLSGVENSAFPLLMSREAQTYLREYGNYSLYEKFKTSQYLMGQLKSIALQSRYIDSVYLYYSAENILIGTGLPKTYNQEELEESGWLPLLRSDENRRLGVWITTSAADDPEHTVVSNFKRIIGQGDRAEGVLVINMKKDFWNQLSSEYTADSSRSMCIDTTGTVLTDRDGEILPEEYYINRISAEGGETRGYYTAKGYTVSYIKSAYNNWYYLRAVKTADLLSRLTDYRNMVFLALLIILAITVLVLSLLTMHIMHPVNVLKEAMEKVGGGNLEAEIHEKRNDDFQILYSGFNRMVENINANIRTMYTQKLKQKDLSMRILRSQINAHFLYNTLETIHWIAELHDDHEVSELVIYLADYYRLMLNKGKDLLTIGDSLHMVQSYLKIWEVKNDGSVSLHADVPEEAKEVFILKNLIQPIIENSLQHGIRKNGDALNISVRCIPDKIRHIITIEIKDDGCGMNRQRLEDINRSLTDDSRKNDEQNFALKNIEEQIKTYYGNEFGIELRSEEGQYTCVIMKLPMH